MQQVIAPLVCQEPSPDVMQHSRRSHQVNQSSDNMNMRRFSGAFSQKQSIMASVEQPSIISQRPTMSLTEYDERSYGQVSNAKRKRSKTPKRRGSTHSRSNSGSRSKSRKRSISVDKPKKSSKQIGLAHRRSSQ